MNELDSLKQTIAGLSEAVKNNATLNREEMVKAVEGALEKQQAARVSENQDKPLRRGELNGELIGPAGAQVLSKGIVTEGKYAGHKADDLEFVEWFLDRAKAKSPGKVVPASKALREAVAVSKALSATGSATGDEYVPTGMAAALWDDMFIGTRVAQQFDVFNMPTDPYEVPLGWGDPTWRKGTQNTATTSSDPATAKSTFTTTEQVLEIDFSYDLDEDAVISVLPTLRSMIGRSGAEQIDKFIMNADATNAATGHINLDDADPADDYYALSNGQDGLRHLVIVDNTGQSTDINTTLTDALTRAGISRLGKYAADTSRLVAFTDPETYVNGLMALTNVVTVDKYGPAATVLTGQLASYAGIPIVVTSSIAEAEDDGKQSTTGSNNDEGTIIFAHRDMWRVGFKRQLLIELDKDVKKRQLVIVASFRIAVGTRGTRSTAIHTSGIHGIVRA